jgi:hypothetical protein
LVRYAKVHSIAHSTAQPKNKLTTLNFYPASAVCLPPPLPIPFLGGWSTAQARTHARHATALDSRVATPPLKVSTHDAAPPTRDAAPHLHLLAPPPLISTCTPPSPNTTEAAPPLRPSMAPAGGGVSAPRMTGKGKSRSRTKSVPHLLPPPAAPTATAGTGLSPLVIIRPSPIHLSPPMRPVVDLHSTGYAVYATAYPAIHPCV